MNRNANCWFLSTDTCLRGWPLHPVPQAIRLYYNAELAWYLHLLLKPVFGYGVADGRDMLIHHVATLALVVLSYGLGLTRIGVLVLCLFNVSNPFLHAAKFLNQLALPARVPVFAAFATIFFVTRVVLVPYSILRVTVWDSWRQVPQVIQDFFGYYVLFNSLLGLLAGLQLLWMWGIGRVLRQAITVGGESASRLSTHVDPSKRYLLVVEESNGKHAAQDTVAVKKEE
ncbi:hypothetical protein N2152v2_010096 [Parachlorella kessleri]